MLSKAALLSKYQQPQAVASVEKQEMSHCNPDLSLGFYLVFGQLNALNMSPKLAKLNIQALIAPV